MNQVFGFVRDLLLTLTVSTLSNLWPLKANTGMNPAQTTSSEGEQDSGNVNHLANQLNLKICRSNSMIPAAGYKSVLHLPILSIIFCVFL